MKIYKGIINFIFPNKCLSCEQIIIENMYFCYGCYNKLNPAKYLSKCEICSKPFQYSTEESVCIECKTSVIYYDKALYVYEYNLPTKQVITKLKFGDKTHLAKKIGQILVQNFSTELRDADFITFVPMHSSKLRERFFNQSALIAKEISKLSNKSFSHNLLMKHKKTSPQAMLTKRNRLENIKNSFKIHSCNRDVIANRSIILIDDVYTTGATVNECAKILKQSNAKKVVILTFAKTLF